MTIYTSEAIEDQEAGLDVPPSIKGGRVRVAMGRFIVPAGSADGSATFEGGDLFIFAKLPSYATIQRIWCSWDGTNFSGGTTMDVGLYYADHVRGGLNGGPWTDNDDYVAAGRPLIKTDILAVNGGVYHNSEWHSNDAGSGGTGDNTGVASIECHGGDLSMDVQMYYASGDMWFEKSGVHDRAADPIWKQAEGQRPKDPNINYYLAGQIKSHSGPTTAEGVLLFTVFFTTD